MNELIKIEKSNVGGDLIETVNARELHTFLESRQGSNIMSEKLVFLGGTCNSSLWRDDAVQILESLGWTCFNPVVAEWTEEAKAKEEEVKKKADAQLFLITPRMSGFFSFMEALDAAHRGVRVMLLVSETDPTFPSAEYGLLSSSLKPSLKLVKDAGGLTMIAPYDVCLSALKLL